MKLLGKWVFLFIVLTFSFFKTGNPLVLASFDPNATTWLSGSLDSRPVFRTNFAVNEGMTGSAKFTPFGLYDQSSNQTFIVYSGGIQSDGINSAQDPIIASFNHTTKTWQSPIRLALTEPLGAVSDGHNYPQVILDTQGLIHVYHTTHGGPPDIIQITSKTARNIGTDTSNWQESLIPDTCNNTYGGAFIDNQGEIYVFHRATHGGNTGYLAYEPENYVKSTDSGKTWSDQIMAIDPGRHIDMPECSKNPDGSYIDSCTNKTCGATSVTHNLPTGTPGPTTIYVGHMLQDNVKNGVWLTFAPNIGHGVPDWPVHWELKYVVFFSFDNDHFYSVDGTDYGPIIDSNEFASCCKISDDNKGDSHHFFVLDDLVSRIPKVYYTRATGNINSVFKASWDSLSRTWSQTDLSETFGSVLEILATDFDPNRGTDIYVKSAVGGSPPLSQCNPPVDPAINYSYPAYVYNLKNSWTSTRIFSSDEHDGQGNVGDHRSWEVKGVSRISTIPDSHPEIRAFMGLPKYTCEYSAYVSVPIKPIWANYIIGNQRPKSKSDTNFDGKIDILDLARIVNKRLAVSVSVPLDTPEDLDSDRDIDGNDLNSFLSQYTHL